VNNDVSDDIIFQVLRAADVLLADEKSWTKGALARNARAGSCYPVDVGAKSFCAAGAIDKAIDTLKRKNSGWPPLPVIREHVIVHFKSACGIRSLLGIWNDATDFEHVKKAFQLAIEALWTK
jgi:hypothetical protein